MKKVPLVFDQNELLRYGNFKHFIIFLIIKILYKLHMSGILIF